MLTFSQYDGNVKKIVAARSGRIYYTAVGAGGGGGGNDSAAGTKGSNGDRLGGYFDVKENDEIYVAVGQGGRGGSSGTNSGAGAGGAALDGFSGGTGGNAGPYGWSGGGGGGGGATVIYKLVNGVRQYLAIAAGGGGGGGGGNRVPGTYIADYYGNSISGTSYTPAGTNGAWSRLGNNYGVWNGNTTYTWQVKSAITATYKANLSIDNYGTMSVNGTPVITLTGSPSSNYGSIRTASITLNAGINTITISGVNTGGPAFVGAEILDGNNTVVWTTRYPTAVQSSAHELLTGSSRGNRGQRNRGDGGGGGGGGGGDIGGIGGMVSGMDPTTIGYTSKFVPQKQIVSGADWGGCNGSRGTSYARGTTTTTGAGGSTMSVVAGVGGGATANGSDGYVALDGQYTEIYSYDTKWNAVTPHIMVSGQFITPKSVYVRNNDQWVEVYGNAVLTHTDLANLMNNASNIETPYTQYYDPVSYDW